MPVLIKGWASAPTIDRVGHRTLGDGLIHYSTNGGPRSPKLLWAHDGNDQSPVGRITRLEARPWENSGYKGLWIEALVIDGDHPRGAELCEILKIQRLSFSVGMYLVDVSLQAAPSAQDPDREILLIERAILDEVSIVTSPACIQAEILEVETLTQQQAADLLKPAAKKSNVVPIGSGRSVAKLNDALTAFNTTLKG